MIQYTAVGGLVQTETDLTGTVEPVPDGDDNEEGEKAAVEQQSPVEGADEEEAEETEC